MRQRIGVNVVSRTGEHPGARLEVALVDEEGEGLSPTVKGNLDHHAGLGDDHPAPGL